MNEGIVQDSPWHLVQTSNSICSCLFVSIYQSVQLLLPGKSHGWRSLVGYSPWVCKESDTTEWLHFLSFCSSLWRGKWQPTPVFLPGESHGRRGLVSYSLWGCRELDTSEQLHFSLSCIGEGNGNPLQCSCLENPRDRGAWWAAIYGVAQNRIWLKWLSSSSY